jgi:serine/threonine-protein kinase RsbW
MLNSQTIELSLPNTLGYERIAMGCSATYAKNVGFDEDRIEDLKTAVAEACINAMLHGNKDLPDARVTVTMNFQDGAIHVEVIDKGRGISVMPGDPDIEKVISGLEPTTGYGLFLIKNLVDQVEFNQMTHKGHAVRMVIKRSNK